MEWNYNMTYHENGITGEKGGTDADRAHIQEQISEVKKQVAELESEKNTRKGLNTIPLESWNFSSSSYSSLSSSAISMRSLPAVSAEMCLPWGRYVNQARSASVRLRKVPGSASPAKGSDAIGNSAPVPSQELSTISTITGLESFLLNRIRDAKKDREARKHAGRQATQCGGEPRIEMITTRQNTSPNSTLFLSKTGRKFAIFIKQFANSASRSMRKTILRF